MPATRNKTQVRQGPASDAYIRLVRAFPLRRITTAPAHARAQRMYLSLTAASASGGRTDGGTRDYLNVLADLIADYELRSHQTMDTSAVRAADLVRHRLAERGRSVSALARAIGIPQPNLSQMLSGRRAWSKTAMRELSKLLNIRAERFLR